MSKRAGGNAPRDAASDDGAYAQPQRTGPPRPDISLLFPPICVACALLANGLWGTLSTSRCLGYLALGLLFWSLEEYLLHRFVFHVRIIGTRYIYGQHEAHHVDNSTALDASPGFIPHLVPLVLPYRLLLHAWLPALFCTLGTFVGYCLYELAHCLIHSNRRGGRLLRRLRRHHMHHHRQPDGCFGVTSPLWDLILGTGRRGT